MRTLGSIVLTIVFAASFAGLVAMHAVHSRVSTDTYFDDILQSSDVYRRLYDEVLLDPAFAPQVDALFGGVDIDRPEIVATMKELIAPAFLESTARTLIARMVDHLDGKKLDLTFDITPIVHGIRDFAPRTGDRLLARVKVRHVDTYAEFEAGWKTILAELSTTAKFPTELPDYPIPEDKQEEVFGLIVTAAQLDDQVPADVELAQAVAKDLVHGDTIAGIKRAAPRIIARVTAESIDKLTHNDYVAIVDGKDGPHYLFGPSGDVHDKIEHELALVQRINRVAGIGRVLAAIAMVLAGAGLVLLHRRGRAAALAWLGAASVVAGAVTFFGWLIARGHIDTSIRHEASSKAMPASFQTIVHDIFTRSVAGLTPAFWIPAAAIAALGVVLIAVAVARR